jgi:Meiotically up-regulated gene 113
MRFYLRGPRVMGIGTGISFGPEDFRRPNTRAQSSSNGGSFLYVITGDHERVKVGVSIDPNKRRAQLQTGSPFPLRIAYVAVTPGTGYDIEGEAKRTLDRYRCPDGSGDEWFNVPVEMAVAAVNAAAFERGQPLCQLTQEALDATLRVMALPEDQQQAFLAEGPLGAAPAESDKPPSRQAMLALLALSIIVMAALLVHAH